MGGCADNVSTLSFMAKILGIDPALNHVGICFWSDTKVRVQTNHAMESMSQFEKMMFQVSYLRALLDLERDTEYVGIEQPYVSSSNNRIGGGHQSANMWAIYCLMLAEIRARKIPCVMFNITQLHSLIIRKRDITKTMIVSKAKEEQPSFGRIDQHSADAYFVAKNAEAFWRFMDYPSSDHLYLSPDQRDIFLSEKTNSKGMKTGIIWRQNDFWVDFRPNDPNHLAGFKQYAAERSTSLTT